MEDASCLDNILTLSIVADLSKKEHRHRYQRDRLISSSSSSFDLSALFKWLVTTASARHERP